MQLHQSQPLGASLVLGGGVALGAFEAGAYAVIAEASAVEIRSVTGASIGAINGAIIAGNAPEQRVAKLRAFWDRIAREAVPSAWVDPFGLAESGPLRTMRNWTNALTTLLTGAPPLFAPRVLTGGRQEAPSLYGNEPAAALIDELVDFDRLNSGEVRFCAAATDIDAGEAVFFDTARGVRIGVEHILASSSLLTLFEPVRVGDRLLVDGGLSCNLPLEGEIGPERETKPEPLCLAIDLYSPQGPRPARLNRAIERSIDLMWGMQTRVRLAGLEREWRLRTELDQLRGEQAAGVDLFLLGYRGREAEEASFGKPFDFSPATLADRWREGERAAEGALERVREIGASAPGLRVHHVEQPS